MRSQVIRSIRFGTIFAALAFIGTTLSACGNTFETASAVTDSLDEFSTTAEVDDQIMMTDTTDFDWDRLYAFNEGTVKSEIDDTIGAELFGDDGDRLAGLGTLLVFVSGDEVAHAVQTTPPLKLLTLDGHGYESDSTTATKSDTGAGWLILADASTDQTSG